MAPDDRTTQQLKLAQAQAKLREAMALHQRGDLAGARQLYEAVLKVQPKSADALNLLGVVAAQTGDYRRAADLTKQAIKINATHPTLHCNLGAALQKLGRFDEAIKSFDQALALKPDILEAYNNRGNALQALGRFDDAIASYDKALAMNVRNGEAHNNRGNALLALARFNEALISYNNALILNPNYADAYKNRGLALKELGHFADAVASYDRALALAPNNPGAYNDRGLALYRLKRFDEAIGSYDKALGFDPNFAEAHHNRGHALQELGRFDEAILSYDKALALEPRSAQTFNSRGLAFHRLKRFEEAIASFDAALAIEPRYAEAHSDRALALQELKRFEEAVAGYDAALVLKPDNAGAYNNRGVALQALWRFDQAFESYDRALALKPDDAEAYSNKGSALQELKRFGEALANYDKALELDLNEVGLHCNRGICLHELKRLDEAIASFDRALAASPESVEANQGRGNALHDLGRFNEALENYDRALSAQPDFLLGTYLHTKMKVCDWTSLSSGLEKLKAGIAAGERVTPPFAAMTLLDDPKLVLKSAQTWCDAKYPNVVAHRDFRKRQAGEKIRIGYFSGDFHNHATAYLIVQMLEEHDRDKFDLFGFSFGPDTNDAMRQRVKATFKEFFDVRGRSDADVAALSAERGIDIAVDLKGFAGDARTGIFAQRCAPVQVNFLGYPATMGSSFIDYIVADKTLIPAESRDGYSEKIVYLPGSYQPNDSRREVSKREFTRQELGLPNDAFVFCCLNNNFKIFPEVFDGWMRILRAVDSSVLWLLQDNATAAGNLRKEAEARGIDGARLVFAERMRSAEHLARHRAADLFLDTAPCNAHTTASDALWAGLPVLTLAGRALAGRVAASLLHAMDLPELVTNTQAEYEAKAIEIATDAEKLRALRRKVETNRSTTPLFNAKTFARNIEAAYQAMCARHEAGLAPDMIDVPLQDEAPRK